VAGSGPRTLDGSTWYYYCVGCADDYTVLYLVPILHTCVLMTLCGTGQGEVVTTGGIVQGADDSTLYFAGCSGDYVVLSGCADEVFCWVC
jgi:hypothetical protein